MHMHPEIPPFLKTQRVGVMAIEMLDGAPHAATVHFAFKEDQSVFVYETSRLYRKSEPLLNRKTSRASFVVGFEEGKNSKTFQTDGEVRLLTDADKALIDYYLATFPEKQAKAADPINIFFTFTPDWWRFTDWSKPTGKTIYTSTDQPL